MRASTALKFIPAPELPEDRTKEHRILVIAQLLVMGVTKSQIKEQILGQQEAKLAWDLPLTTIDSYIAEAEESLQDEANKLNLTAQRGVALCRLNEIFKRAMDKHRFGEALAAESKRIGLLGLDQIAQAPESDEDN